MLCMGFMLVMVIPLKSVLNSKIFLQDLMNRHLLQINHEKKEEVFVQIGAESSISKPEPLMIHVTRESVVPIEVHPVVIQVPSPCPYKSDKAVPWKYGINVLKQEPKGDQKTEVSNTIKVTVDNITGIGGMTKSGRLFAPAELRRDRSHKKPMKK